VAQAGGGLGGPVGPGGGGGVGVVLGGGGAPGGGGGGGAGGSVEADDGVEVDLAPFLVLGDLGVREGGVIAQGPLSQPRRLGDLPTQVGGEACPQRWGVRVPQHRARVVVPLGVERGAQQSVVVGVDLAAVAAAGVGLVVDGAEAGCGEGGEHARVRGHACRDGLATAQSGCDELVGVVAVDGRAGRAAGGAAVAAADQQFARREPAGVEVIEDRTGNGVQVGEVSGEADRVRAAAERADLSCEGCEVAGGGELRQLGGEPGAALQRRMPTGRVGGAVCRGRQRGWCGEPPGGRQRACWGRELELCGHGWMAFRRKAERERGGAWCVGRPKRSAHRGTGASWVGADAGTGGVWAAWARW
jgi:hypothetical protein